jgi:nucleoside-diphosphate-sugar epimerase
MQKILILGGNGYIGSQLINDYANYYKITSVDLCWYNSNNSETLKIDYNNLSDELVQDHDAVILLAGHSSVKMCEGNIKYAYNNNVRNFINLLSKLLPSQKLIYASSSSIYGTSGEIGTEDYHSFMPHNQYDITKHIIDLYAPKFDVQYYGLRFGTVNGYSPNTRKDVMINSMTYSALHDKEIKLFGKDIRRPILGLTDLSRAIKTIIDCTEDKRGIYNLASFNKTSGEIAYGVSSIIDIPVKEYEVDPFSNTAAANQPKTYNFSIDCSKFCQAFNFEFVDTIETITSSIIANFNTIEFTDRSNIIEYEK